MLSHLFLQIALLLAVCQLIAYALRRVHQPPVIGQMIAGLMLGPSVLGLALPGVQHLLFPFQSLGVIRWLGQLGLVLYMFVVGVELNHGLLRRHIKGATAVSLASVGVPLVIGAAAALLIAQDRSLFPPGVTPLTACLFFAAAISVTAFPVMARLIVERDLVGTTIANVALAAGSVSDAVAWCLLALVIASLSGTLNGAAITSIGAIAFTGLVILAVRPALRRMLDERAVAGSATWPLATLLITVLVAGWTTDALGIHPAFGAFLIGAVTPRNETTSQVTAKITPLAANLLLPLFFVYTGLNTSVGLVNSERLLLVAAAIILLACGSKGIACWLAARLAGFGVRDATAIGALMNARGLIELIILTAALEKHVITPTLFSIMVVMAVVTTVMASPVLRLLYGARHPEFEAARPVAEGAYTSLSSPEPEPATA
ncbi:MAG TPA: cation:proton antiporter [Candidatus Dormibacteraeota bacterium]|nr:cation:proton antiporter [Candidatus Dormibacteraeota bacterium]